MIRMEMRGLAELRARFNRMQAAASDLSPVLAEAGLVIRDHAVKRIHDGGEDQNWPPNKAGTHTGIDTGRMQASIGITQTTGTTVSVGTNVRSKGGFPYARAFQYGRGPIEARAGKSLRFVMNGVVYYRKRVGPQPARPFLLIVDADRERIKAIFLKYLRGDGA
jgi:phage gpG-like protein